MTTLPSAARPWPTCCAAPLPALPDKPAIRCGDTAWTWREFDAVASRLAAGLHAEGVARGDRVAVLARNSHGFAALRFALARLGAVLVPVNFMLNADEAAYILRHAGARLLAVDSGLAALGKDAASRDTRVERLLWLPSEQASAAPAGIALRFDALIDTSSRAARARHRPRRPAADRLHQRHRVGAQGRDADARRGDRPVRELHRRRRDGRRRHRAARAAAVPLRAARRLPRARASTSARAATSPRRRRPTTCCRCCERHRISAFFAPPTVWIGLLRSPLFDRCDLSSLRKGYYGASIMPVEVMRELTERLPNMRLWNFYGQTEIAPLATVLKPEDQLRKPGSAGRPALNVETRVVDDAMRDVAPGEVGEIVHRSPQLLQGYFNDPERTRRRVRGRLVPFGRPRHHRRRGLHHGGRPQEGHDQERRRERRQPRGRRGAVPARGRQRGRGGRPAASALDRGGDRGGGGQVRPHARRGRACSRMRRSSWRPSSARRRWCSSMRCPRTRAASC